MEFHETYTSGIFDPSVMAHVKFCDDNICFRKSCFPLIILVYNEFVYSEPYLSNQWMEFHETYKSEELIENEKCVF